MTQPGFIVAGCVSSGNRLLASILIRSGCRGSASTDQPMTPKEIEQAGDKPMVMVKQLGLRKWIQVMRDKDYDPVTVIVIVREPVATLRSALKHGHCPSIKQGRIGRIIAISDNIISAKIMNASLEIITYEGLTEDFLLDWLPTIGLKYASGALSLPGQTTSDVITNVNAKHYNTLRKIGAQSPNTEHNMIREYKWHGHSLRFKEGEWNTANNILSKDEYAVMVIYNAGQKLRTVVDIGANIGAFSVLVAHFWPDAKVYAVEPHPDTYKLLCDNVAPFSNVTPIQAAITDATGTAVLTDLPQSTGNRVSETWCALQDRLPYVGLEVPSLSIMDLLEKHGIQTVDLLKCDCEGGEYAIFEQLRRAGWLGNVGWIRGEWHHKPSNYRLHAALDASHVLSVSKNEPHGVGPFIAHRR